MSGRVYPDAQRAEVVALALVVGDKEATKRTGVPRRTITRWRAEVRDGDERAVAIMDAPTREQVVAKLWEGVTAAGDAVVEGLANPKARLGDQAKALDVLTKSHALLSGGVTNRTETLHGEADPEHLDGLAWFEHYFAPFDEADRRFLRESIDDNGRWLMEQVILELTAARAEGRPPVPIEPPPGRIGTPDTARLAWQADVAGHEEARRRQRQLTDGRNGE